MGLRLERKILLNLLHEAQDEHGYLSEHVLKQLSLEHDIPISQLYGVAKFYMMLKTKPQGKNIIEICGSPSCILNNGESLENFLKKNLKIKVGETTKNKKFSLYKTSCIGCCDEAPAMLINQKAYTKLTVARLKGIIKKLSD